jgi:hypothetical protein
MESDNTNPVGYCHDDASLHLDSGSGSKEYLGNSHDHLNHNGYESRPKLSDCDNIIQNKVTLDFKIRIEDNDNQGRLAKATFTYKYFPSDDSIKYIDVNYTHPKLQSVVECNPNIMKNIDSYIRDLLLAQKIRT